MKLDIDTPVCLRDTYATRYGYVCDLDPEPGRIQVCWQWRKVHIADRAKGYHRKTWFRPSALSPWTDTLVISRPSASREKVVSPHGIEYFRDVSEESNS